MNILTHVIIIKAMKVYTCHDCFNSDIEAIEYLKLFCFCDCKYMLVNSVSFDRFIASFEGIDLYYVYASDSYVFAS